MSMEIPWLSLKKVTAMHQEEIEDAVNSVVESGWFLQGEHTRKFEESYAKYIGTRHCVGCGNGLDALTLIFRAYKEMGVMGNGDEVIVPANAYIASILSITENGLRPVLVEPTFDTLEIDGTRIEKAISPKTKAILLVHMYGRNSWSMEIMRICKRHHIVVVEDNAQAHGCMAETGRRTGSLGDAAAHSFYPSKNLGALGDAGAITTNDQEMAETIRALGNYGSAKKYVFKYKGKNSRLDEIQAAVLCVKLKYLDVDNARRREIASYYYAHINNSAVKLPGKEEWLRANGNDVACNYHIFPVLCPQRDGLRDWLAQLGIGTAIHYPIPPHRQVCYSEWNSMSLPITEAIHEQELSLPCNQTMTDDEVRLVCEGVNGFSPK